MPLKPGNRLLYRGVTRVNVVKENWKAAARRNDLYGLRGRKAAEKKEYEAPQTQKSVWGGEFKVTKKLMQFDSKPKGVINTQMERNTRIEDLNKGGFQDSIHINKNKTPEQQTIKANLAKDAARRVREFLFKNIEKNEGAPPVSDMLCELILNHTDKSKPDVIQSIKAANHEIPLALYHLDQEHPRQPHSGVVSAEIIQDYGGAVIRLECETVERSLGEGFLRLAKRISRTAAMLPMNTPPDKVLQELLTTQLTDSDVYVCDELIKASTSWGETVTVTSASLVPSPEGSLFGWYVHNPRDLYPGQGAGIAFVTFLLSDSDTQLLEPEWMQRLQDTIPARLAEHCLLEPLYRNKGGRILKQTLVSPLTPAEHRRYPTYTPTVYDWLEDEMYRARVTASRFGLVSTVLSPNPATRTWVSLSAEAHRYDKFSSRTDPPPAADGSRNMQAENTRIKADHKEEELWFNEPGQMTETELQEEQKNSNDDGFETDDELMRKGV
eukprot:TRINITY_DN18368_c0_g1_i2.p1 TRINITY_DN18368_c0_g1~~TRINITY_DN18368_c0_g1_i2.p1  ORF type:complete len:514 (+),score=95.69 TRINITY_DN18368_c0_g1_i2:55-1542(+)